MKNQLVMYVIASYCALSSLMFAKIKYTGHETVVLDGGFESKNAFINYIIIGKQRYILKQKKDISQIAASAMRDSFAAYIARNLGITHLVKIIAPEDNILGKVYQNYPATVHTIVPGVTIRNLINSKYSYLTLQLITLSKLNEKWLDTILPQISWHKQLSIMVALDLFLCNTDRHRGNIFYDESTDSFYAIDMDNIYRLNMPEIACAHLDRMIYVDKRKFTKQEIEALMILKSTLERLLKKYTPHKLIDCLHKCAHKAGYINLKSYVDKKIGKKIARQIARHEEIIVQSYASIQTFVMMLNKVINTYYKKGKVL